MVRAGETTLVAIALPPDEAVRVIWRAWDAGEAVLPLDPAAPATETRRIIAAFRPTHLHGPRGRVTVPDGVPVTEGTAAVVATSGTTAEPKGVVLSGSALRASAAAVLGALEADATDRWLCCLPLHHVAGLAIVARSWVTGVPPEVHPRFDTAAVGAAAGEGQTTLTSLVPTMLSRLLDADVPVHRFRRVLVGGSALEPGLAARAEAAGIFVVTTYGLTETWGGVVHDGHPLAGVDLRLDDRDEILVRGPMLMTGYHRAPTGPDTATSDGWLRTGDVGRIDGGGRLSVVDRLADHVITGGVNVSPSEVETALAAHPRVADICIVGAPDAEWGERVVACVVPRDPDDPPTLDALREFGREHLGTPKLPRELVLIDAVPRTAGGKPLRRLLRTRGDGQDSGHEDTASNRSSARGHAERREAAHLEAPRRSE